jgi:hypothetical protein
MVRLDEQKLARAALTYLAEPADPALGALLGICEPAEVLAAIKSGMLPGAGPGCGDSPASRLALERALGRWRARLGWLPDDADIAGACRDGIRLVCPGIRNGRAGWMSWARPARTRCGCAAGLTWGWLACARRRWWGRGPPPRTARTSPGRSRPTSASEAG